MYAYELHILRNGKWGMDSVFDDRDLAIHEATRAEDTRRYAGIRIVEEHYDEDTDETTARIIFRGGTSATPKKNESSAKQPTAMLRPSKNSKGREPTRKTAARRNEAEKKTSGWIVPTMICLAVLIILLGCVAMYMLA